MWQKQQQGKEQEKFELYKKPHDSLLLTVANLFPIWTAFISSNSRVFSHTLSFHVIRSHFYLNVPPFIFGFVKNQTTALQMDRTMLTLGSLIVLKIGFSRILAHAALRKSRHWFSITNLLLASTNSTQLHSHNVTTSNAKNPRFLFSFSNTLFSPFFLPSNSIARAFLMIEYEMQIYYHEISNVYTLHSHLMGEGRFIKLSVSNIKMCIGYCFSAFDLYLTIYKQMSSILLSYSMTPICLCGAFFLHNFNCFRFRFLFSFLNTWTLSFFIGETICIY